MPFTPAWNEADPADADPIASGATEVRDLKLDIRQRIDSLLGDGTTPTPPATLADLDTTFSTNVSPLRIRGDRVDLRGQTYRTQSASLSSAVVTVVNVLTFIDTGMQLTITPVSANSLLVFHVEALLTLNHGSANWTTAKNVAGRVKVFNSTDSLDLSPNTIVPINTGTFANVQGEWLSFTTTPLTGITAATLFKVQMANMTTGMTFIMEGAIEPARFTCIEYV